MPAKFTPAVESLKDLLFPTGSVHTAPGRPEPSPPVDHREHLAVLPLGRHGAAVRTLVHPDGIAPRVARAVALIRQGFDRPARVEALAAAGMSPSTFHHHFRAVTSVSPLQFQKQLCLIEARRLVLTQGMAASRAAYAVGYESVPQSTREYARMFGAPPGRDARGQRAA